MKYVLNVEEEFIDGESSFFITLPYEVCIDLDVTEGDMIEWVDREDGSFEIKKAKE